MGCANYFEQHCIVDACQFPSDSIQNANDPNKNSGGGGVDARFPPRLYIRLCENGIHI